MTRNAKWYQIVYAKTRVRPICSKNVEAETMNTAGATEGARGSFIDGPPFRMFQAPRAIGSDVRSVDVCMTCMRASTLTTSPCLSGNHTFSPWSGSLETMQ